MKLMKKKKGGELVYENNVMSDSTVWYWCRKFRNGFTNVHDEGGKIHPLIVTDELV